MTQSKKSLREVSNDVHKAVQVVRKVVDAYRHLKPYPFFDNEGFKNGGFDKLVDNVAKQHNVPKEHVLWVANITENTIQ